MTKRSGGGLLLTPDEGARAETPAKSPKTKPPVYDPEEVSRLYGVEDAAEVELLGRLLAGARGTIRLDPNQLKAISILHEIRIERLGSAGAAVDRVEVVFGDDPDDGSEDR